MEDFIVAKAKTLKEPSITKVIKRAKAVSKGNTKKSSSSKTKAIKTATTPIKNKPPALNHLIGQAIAKYRKQTELSQEQLAEALGIGYEAVSRMERGVVVPSVERLIQIAEVVDCPVTELLTQSSPRPCDEAIHLHALLSSVSNDDKQMLITLLKNLITRLKNSDSK